MTEKLPLITVDSQFAFRVSKDGKYVKVLLLAKRAPRRKLTPKDFKTAELVLVLHVKSARSLLAGVEALACAYNSRPKRARRAASRSVIGITPNIARLTHCLATDNQ